LSSCWKWERRWRRVRLGSQAVTLQVTMKQPRPAASFRAIERAVTSACVLRLWSPVFAPPAVYRTTVVHPSWIWMLPPVVPFNASHVAGQAMIFVGPGMAPGATS
jgi:hypothetical protein